MAYEKQTWSCGDEISAEKLNHMEDGIYDASQGGGGGTSNLVVLTPEHDDYTDTLPMTWQEIHDAIGNGTFFLIKLAGDLYPVTSARYVGDEEAPYVVCALGAEYTTSPSGGAYSISFIAQNANDNPVYS